MRLSAMHGSALLFLLLAQISLVMLIMESSAGLSMRCAHDISPIQRFTFCRERTLFRPLAVEHMSSTHSSETPREGEANKKAKTIKIITRWIKQGAKSLRSALQMT